MKWTLLCCISAALALPRRIVHKRRFSVHQIEVQAPKRSAYQHHFKTARKYSSQVPHKIAIKLVDAQAKWSVEATPEQGDAFYLCPVTIGGQTLNLDFDTGSSDLWVYSSQTPNALVDGRTVYDTSTGTLLPGESWSITYGDRSGASGDVYADTVTIGGLAVSNQAVEVAQNLQGSWSNLDQDGLLGLAFSNLNMVQPTQQQTFFDNAVSQGLQQQLFAVSLKAGQPGTYDFGYIDSTKYTGEITYLPVSQAVFWQVSDPVMGETILDTGTSLMYMPSFMTQAYYSQIPSASNAQGLWLFDCSETMPDFIFSMGTLQTGVAAQHMNFGQASATLCVGALQDRDGLGIPMNILGDAYLKGKYVVFDLNGGAPQVGIAAGVDGPVSSS